MESAKAPKNLYQKTISRDIRRPGASLLNVDVKLDMTKLHCQFPTLNQFRRSPVAIPFGMSCEKSSITSGVAAAALPRWT